jgi:Ca2+-binding EF-hand superfamily protein
MDQQAQSTNFKEAFSLFDKRGNGRVALGDLGDLLRACGQNPTLAEIKDLEAQMGGDCKRIPALSSVEKAARIDTYWPRDFSVDFDNFQRVLNRPGGFRDPGEPEEYCRGFQVFDKELTGFIGVGQFRYILTNLGEKMSDEEVDELLKAVDTSSGELNYMGELLLMCFRKTGVLTKIQTWSRRSSQTKEEKASFPFYSPLFSFTAWNEACTDTGV